MNASFRIAALILLNSIWVSALAAVPTNISYEAHLTDDGGATTNGLSGSLHGRKWLDNNGNGQQDANEPGLAGVTIYLDLNNNGSLDNGEPFTVTKQDDPTTDSDAAG